jgi:hypothetical protein
MLALVLAGCAGVKHEIVEDRWEISESTSIPEVTDVADVGGGDVPLSGTLPMEASDGIAVIGETLWIRGNAFGRQPSVTVGGRPAAVLGRTRDGGIAVRVPIATPTGSQPVVVRNEVGHGERPIAIRRYAAVLSPGSGQLGWAELAGDGPIAAGTTAVERARWLAMSADGRAAYVAPAGRSILDVIEIPAAGTPKPIYRLDLGSAPVLALAAATRAPVLAVVREADLVVVDTSSPLRPARSAPRALPKELRSAGLAAADVSPDGKLLALALETSNQVLLFDLTARGNAPVVATIPILPAVRAGVLVDCAFSPAGDTLWVLSGDTPRSRPTGPQPTELRAVRLNTGSDGITHFDIARVVKVGNASAPGRIAVGRALPLASGAAIRLPPERATLFFTALGRETGTPAPDGLVTMDGAPAGGGPPPGAGPAPAAPAEIPTTFRVGAEDEATVALTAPARLGLPDLSFDGRWLLAPTQAPDGAVRVVSTVADGRPGPSPRPADVIAPRPGEMPPATRPLPILRIQP